MPSTSESAITLAIKDILLGFARTDRERIALLSETQEWPRFAREELERRATRILQVLDDKTLQAIAAGQVDMTNICREVINQIVNEDV